MKTRPTEAWHVVSEPGDGTHYEFLVATLPEDPDSLWVASVSRGSGCPVFAGYPYGILDLLQFGAEWSDARDASYEDYEKVLRAKEKTHHLVGYACEHSAAPGSPLNPWTAIAGLFVGERIARTLTQGEPTDAD